MPESILHFGAVTMRVQGEGDLIMTLFGINKVKSFIFTNPIQMNTSPRTEPTRLSNFNSQRAIFRFETNEKDDFLNISRILIWVKPVGTSFPGNLNA
jgi:hypothetical protein